MKIKFFQNYSWYNITGWILLVIMVFGAVVLIRIIHKVDNDGLVGHGIVLSDNDHHSTAELRTLFILENKPHIFWTSNWRVRYCDCVEIKYIENDIDWSDVGGKCDSNYFANKVVIYGFDYPAEKSQEIRVYDHSLLIKSLKFTESFGLVIDNKPSIRVEYLQDGKLMHNRVHAFYEVYKTNIINLDYSDIEE